MINALAEALKVLHTPSEQRQPVCTTDPLTYLQAAAEVVDNVDALPYRVFVMLPPRSCVRGNDHWDNVMQHSHGIGHGGLERVIEPISPRQTFMPSSRQIVLRMGDKIFLRPRGAPQVATYVRLSIEPTDWGACLIPLPDPFCESLLIRHERLGAMGYTLDTLADVLATNSDGKFVLTATSALPSEPRVPIASVIRANGVRRTVTIHLDAAVEQFVPVGWRHITVMN